MYPLVKELATDGIPVVVSLRVLKLARQPYYRWLENPLTRTDLDQAYRANALHAAAGDNAAMESFFALLRRTCSIDGNGPHGRSYARRS